VTFDEMEAWLRARLDAAAGGRSRQLLHVLRLPDFDRAERIGEFWGHPETRTFGELLIDLEEGKARAVACARRRSTRAEHGRLRLVTG
jgi:hypothetical protein